MSQHMSVMPIALSMPPLHSLGHNDEHEVKHDFSVIVVALLPCDANCIISGIILFIRLKPIVSSLTPFHLLCQDDQYEMQHDISGHVLPPELASCDANGIINGTIAFV